jgi:hypothetical protein
MVLAQLLNATIPRRGYRVVRDLGYGKDPRHKLDLYIPNGLTTSAVVLTSTVEAGNGAARRLIASLARPWLQPASLSRSPPRLAGEISPSWRTAPKRFASCGGRSPSSAAIRRSSRAFRRRLQCVLLAADRRYLSDEARDAVRGIVSIAGFTISPVKDPALIDMFGGDRVAWTQPIGYDPQLYRCCWCTDRATWSCIRAICGGWQSCANSAPRSGARFEASVTIEVIICQRRGFAGATLRDDVVRFGGRIEGSRRDAGGPNRTRRRVPNAVMAHENGPPVDASLQCSNRRQ